MKLFAVFRIVALAVAMTGAGYLAGHAYVSNQKIVFYAALFALSQSIFWIVQSTRLRGIPGLGLAARICVLSALLLPIADWLYQPRSEQAAAAGPPEPAYSFRAAKGNPEAFSRWWAYYTNEWTKPDGGQARLQGPDPRGTLPYVLLPNTQGQFFQHMYHINNLGFHGRDFAAEKGNEYRIFVVGELARVRHAHAERRSRLGGYASNVDRRPSDLRSANPCHQCGHARIQHEEQPGAPPPQHPASEA